jgi:hypothetical protein
VTAHSSRSHATSPPRPSSALPLSPCSSIASGGRQHRTSHTRRPANRSTHAAARSSSPTSDLQPGPLAHSTPAARTLRARCPVPCRDGPRNAAPCSRTAARCWRSSPEPLVDPTDPAAGCLVHAACTAPRPRSRASTLPLELLERDPAGASQRQPTRASPMRCSPHAQACADAPSP